MTNEQEKAQ